MLVEIRLAFDVTPATRMFIDWGLADGCLWQIEARNNMLEMQAQNNGALVQEMDTLLERLRVPPEVCAAWLCSFYIGEQLLNAKERVFCVSYIYIPIYSGENDVSCANLCSCGECGSMQQSWQEEHLKKLECLKMWKLVIGWLVHCMGLNHPFWMQTMLLCVRYAADPRDYWHDYVWCISTTVWFSSYTFVWCLARCILQLTHHCGLFTG